MRTKEYHEGYEAYWGSACWSDNPYDDHTQQYEDWREGFHIALLEEEDSYNAYYGE